MQGYFKMRKSANVIYHINRFEKEKKVDQLTNTEKVFD